MFKQSILFCLAAAADNEDGCAGVRSCWKKTDNKESLVGKPFPVCERDKDCKGNDHFCLAHMWKYDGQEENGIGCVKKGVCKGNGTWLML